MRRATAAALAAALLVLGTACTGLPQDGPVVTGPALGGANPVGARLIPNPAPPGASQEELVSGLLKTMSSYDVDRSVLKTYLAEAASRDWSTALPVTVFDAQKGYSVTRVDAETIKLSAPVVATIDADGRYRQYPAGQVASTTLNFVRVAGQWRIRLPKDFSLWIGTDRLTDVFSPQGVYYSTPTGRHLVADVRWFATGPNTVTTLARARLGPIPAYLAGAVAAVVPAGTALTVAAVPVQNGVAAVDLTSQVLGDEPDQRKALWASLAATLLRLPEVSSVSLSVDGHPLEIEGTSSSLVSPEILGYALPPVPAAGSVLLRVDASLRKLDPWVSGGPDAPTGTASATVSAAQPTVDVPTDYVDLAQSVDGKVLAAVSRGRDELTLFHDLRVVPVPVGGGALTKPSFDVEGFLWVSGVEASGQARIWVTGVGDPVVAPVTAVSAPWLTGRIVTSLRVSPDGTRALVVSHRVGEESGARVDRLDVVGIARAANERPEQLASPLNLASPIRFVRDVVWIDNQSFGVLGRTTASGPLVPIVASIGTGIEVLGSAPPGRPVAITCPGDARSLIVVTEGGKVFRRVGGSWPQLATGTDVVIPGR